MTTKRYGHVRQEVRANWPEIKKRLDKDETRRAIYKDLHAGGFITGAYSNFVVHVNNHLREKDRSADSNRVDSSSVDQMPLETTTNTANSQKIKNKSLKKSAQPEHLSDRQVIGGRDEFKPKTQEGEALLWGTEITKEQAVSSNTDSASEAQSEQNLPNTDTPKQ